MKKIILLVTLMAPFSAQALEVVKCNSESGRTLWASFGKRLRSGTSEPTYFPTEIVIFRSRTELQDRLLFNSSKDAAGIPVEVTSATIHFAFPAKNAVGEIQTEALRLRLYSPGKSTRAYVGEWASGKEKIESRERVACSVY